MYTYTQFVIIIYPKKRKEMRIVILTIMKYIQGGVRIYVHALV